MDKTIKKYLGIDWGEKRIGLALADSENKIAVPYKVVAGLDEIKKVIQEEEIDILVVGEPVSLAGRKDFVRSAPEFLNFLELLKRETSRPVKTIDERLSSRGADAMSGGKKDKAARDALAAMLILQNFLDRMNA